MTIRLLARLLTIVVACKAITSVVGGASLIGGSTLPTLSIPSNTTNINSSTSPGSLQSTASSLFASATPASEASHSLTSGSPSSTLLTSSPVFEPASSSPSASSTVHAAASTSAVPVPSSTLDPATLTDIETMIQRRLSFIVGGVTDTSNIPEWLSTLGPDGKWPDSEIDYTTGCDARRANWPAENHWIRLLTMSAAWHGGVPGAEQYVKDPTLQAGISRAMDFWFSNDFNNPSCLDSGGAAACPCGTPGLWNTNWFSNIIGVPNLVAQSCLLINDTLTDPQHNNCTKFTGRTYGTFGHNVNGLGIATGANLLDIAKIGIDQGLLNFNASILADAYSRIHGEMVIENATFTDGIRADGSFGQHGGVLYNGNYGKVFGNDALLLEIVAGNTQFAAGEVARSALANLIDGDVWMVYRNIETNVSHWDFSALGRFISFPVIDGQASASVDIDLTQIKQLGEEWDSDVLTSAYEKLSAKTNNANVGSIDGNRMFYNNDYMVQRGPGYVTTLKMFSTRTKNGECLNDQNPLGFHLSDGTLYTYMKGSEYEDISVAWDWNLIPGITVDYGATPLTCNSGVKGRNAFVGGASDGTVGVAAMSYTNPTTRAMSFQKAWFFLDDNTQRVMIPVAKSTSNMPIFSVVDQKRYRVPILVNSLPTVGNTNFSNAETLWHDNVGYIFDQNVNLSVEAGPRTGNWADIGISTQGEATIDLFAAWIDHGPAGTPFTPVSYTIFPAIDNGAFYARVPQTRITNIQNDAHITAVYDEAHRTAMFVFWDIAGGTTSFKPSTREAPLTIATNGNSAVILRLDTGEVTVSDPSQTLGTLQLTFTVGNVGSKPPGWGDDLSKQLTFQLPSGGLAGASISQKL